MLTRAPARDFARLLKDNPPAPADLWSSLRTTMDAFEAATTPGWAMGSISEAVRTWPGARRSDHPHFSFAALGGQHALPPLHLPYRSSAGVSPRHVSTR